MNFSAAGPPLAPALSRPNAICLVVLATLCAAATVRAGDGRAEFWVDLLGAEPVEQPEEMWRDLRGSDVIYMGEFHDLERHHRMEVKVLREIFRQSSCRAGTRTD